MTHPSLKNLALKLLAAGLLSVGLLGCADMSGITPQAQLRDAQSLGLEATAAAPAPIDAQWWRAFGDEQLNRLEDQALLHSPNLGLAQARLASAQALMETVNASSKPQLAAQLDATYQHYTANGAVPPPLAGSERSSGTAQLNASWEFDFFGKNRAALDAALGNANAAQMDAQAAQVLLASQVARSYFQWRRLNDQVSVAQRTLAQREELLKLVQDRVNAGLDTALELRQSQGSLPDARLQLEILNEQMALTQHALAALIGQGTQPLVITATGQAAIKQAALNQTIPADLLGQRADIAAARWRVEAASSSVQSAKAQFYPNVNLVAFAGFSSIGLDKLLQSGSQQWGVGPALRLPIFDGGRLRAGLRGKTAELDAAVESYNSAVVNAVRDVADQVTSAQAITRQQTEQTAAAQAAQDAYDIALQRYRAGLGNYLTVLNAESTVLTQRRLTVDLSARALDTQVALIHALGGGYSTHTSQTP
jgi:NodT family efflux transporter outer membrane factor (OMF) lipoprotein